MSDDDRTALYEVSSRVESEHTLKLEEKLRVLESMSLCDWKDSSMRTANGSMQITFMQVGSRYPIDIMLHFDVTSRKIETNECIEYTNVDVASDVERWIIYFENEYTYIRYTISTIAYRLWYFVLTRERGEKLIEFIDSRLDSNIQ